MRLAALVPLVLVLALAGCHSDSADSTGDSSSETTAADGARPVSPSVELPPAQQASVDDFTRCAVDAGYIATQRLGVPGGASVTVAKSGDQGTVLATFVLFPDGTAAAIGAQRDQQTVEGTGGGIIRKGLAELAAYSAEDLTALKPCL